MVIFDTEVVKHLPWEEELLGPGNKCSMDGFPHVFFAGVAFWSAVLEDVPQIALQIWFILEVEGDNGWAVTGAMASLTVSVADVLVRVVFPVLVRIFARARPLKRQNCIRRLQRMEPGVEREVLGGSGSEGEEMKMHSQIGAR